MLQRRKFGIYFGMMLLTANGLPKQWGASTESYFMDEKDGITSLKVELNMEAEEWFESYFNSTFPKALEVVKQLAEE